MMDGALASGESPASAPQPDTRVTLRLLATSDLHGHVRSFDYANDCPVAGVGLEAVERTVAQLRGEGLPCLLLDAGDFLFGSALGDLALDPDWTGPHPVVSAMNRLGYDAVGLGNHDFDHGPVALNRALRDAAFPVLGSNLGRAHAPGRDRPTLPIRRTRIADMDATDARGGRHRVRVGLLSLLPPELIAQVRARYAHFGRMAVQGVAEAARDAVSELRRQGADVVVALCHDGMERGAPDRPGSPLGLARSGGIDAIVMGHQHGTFPGPDAGSSAPDPPDIDRRTGHLAGIPAIMPGCWGQHVGAIDLTLARGSGGTWRVDASAVRLHTTSRPLGHSMDVALPSIVGRAHECARLRDGRVLGRLPRAATSYLARIGRCPGTMLMAQILADTVRDEIGDARGLPIIGLAAPLRSGGAGGPDNYADIPKGPLRMGHLSGIHPFPDRVCAVEITGADLRDWYERGAAGFHRMMPGYDGDLVDTRLPGSDFHLSPQVRVTLDLGRAAQFATTGERIGGGPGRVRSISYRGRALTDDARVLIAVTEYRAGGGGGFPGCVLAAPCWRSRGTVRDAIDARAGRALSPDLWRAALRLRWPAGADPVFVTGAGALRHPAVLLEAGLLPPAEPHASGTWVRCRFAPPARPLDSAAASPYLECREVGAGRHLANPVRSGRKQP